MKIYLDTIGCRLNQAEIEAYARQLRLAGHTLVAAPNEADLAVVNTCAVTSAAVSDSRQKIRLIERAGVDQIIATGCWATLKPTEAAALPGVRQVVENSRKDLLVADLLQTPQPEFELEPLERQPIPGLRLRTRLFIKAQDGCNNRCTFCITTLARGSGRSRPIPEVLNDIRLSEGVQEIVLTGVHLGSWGKDLLPRLHLKDLARALLDETDIPRIRLSSLEPWNLDESFFELWQNPRLCPHLHLPLQSGCAETLRRMARKTTPPEFARLVAAVRSQVPEISITTDVIVGFPGETEREFEQSLDFVRQLEFSGGHVFTYSARPGTAAASMASQIPLAERKARNARMRAVFTEAAESYRSLFIGQTLAVLWESATAYGPQGWEMNGLTDNYLRVRAHAPKSLWNQITPVELSQARPDSLYGRICF